MKKLKSKRPEGSSRGVTHRLLPLAALALSVTHCGGPDIDLDAPQSGHTLGVTSAALSRRQRAVFPKPAHARADGTRDQQEIIVKFVEGSHVRFRAGSWALDLPGMSALEEHRLGRAKLDKQSLPGHFTKVHGLIAGDASIRVQRMFSRSEAELDAEQEPLEAASGEELADLNLYYTLHVPTAKSEALVDALNASELVENAHFAPKYVSLAVDIPPTTSDFSPYQFYLKAAPTGFDARYAWTQPGGTGTGVKIIDVELAWNLSHEDLDPPFWQWGTMSTKADVIQHGTSVLGEMVAAKNSYGVTGASYGATYGVAAISGSSVANAINAATPQLRTGDVILIEVGVPVGGDVPASGTTCVCNCGQFDMVPVEWEQAEFDAIKRATSGAINVVEPAGNGAANLDAAIYQNRFKYQTRDSGAIMVGAADRNHQPECYTGYGSRVDVHGFGDSVQTFGGTASGNSSPDQNQWYDPSFAGTSSASPMIAAAIADLNGNRRARSLIPDFGTALRFWLGSSGTPQATPVTKHIGAMPDLRAYITNAAEPPALGNVVAAKQSSTITSVFVAGADTQLKRWSASGTGAFQGPYALTTTTLVPAGANLATGKPTSTELDVFFVGVDGKLSRVYEQNDGTWQAISSLTAANFAPPGAPIATGVQNGTTLDVFVIDNSGNLQMVSTTGNGTWTGPTLVASNFAAAGAYLATGNQGTGQLDVFAANQQGTVRVTWVVGNGVWNAAVSLSATSVTKAGGPIATGIQNGNQLDVFYVGNDSYLKAYGVVGTGLWLGPWNLTSSPVATYGARLSTLVAGNQLDVFYTTGTGDLGMASVVGNGAWTTQTLFTDALLPTAATATAAQSSSLYDLFLIGNIGLARSTSTAGTSWATPTKLPPP